MIINTRKITRALKIPYCAALLFTPSVHADESGAAEPKDTPTVIMDVKEAAEKSKRAFETADRYRFSRNRPKPPEREDLPVTLRRNQDKIFALDTPVLAFGVIAFTTAAGQPLAGLSTTIQRADFVRGGIPVLGGQYVGKNLCLTAVVPGDTGKIVIWNALSDDLADSVRGSVIMKNCAPEKTDTLKPGLTVWDAKTLSAKEYRVIPNLEQTVVIRLPAHTGFLYAPPQGGRTMYYANGEGAQYTIEPDGGKLFLFCRAEGGAGNVEFETYARRPQSTPNAPRPSCRPPQCELSSGIEIIRQPSIYTREIIRVKGEPSAHRRLYISGSAEGAEWISQSGRMTPDIKNGSGLSGESGVLTVRYAPGRARIGLCKDDGSILGLNECRWGEGVIKWGEAPAVRGMTKAVLADGVNWYSIELSEPTHVSLRASLPAAAAIAVDGRIRDYEEFEDALSWDVPLSKGKFTIGVKSISQNSTIGVPLTIGFYPIPALTEKNPLETYLMPGQKRMARFEIGKKGNAGLWMAADEETAEAVLMDRAGKKISAGRQIFAELDKGRYYVLLSAPATPLPASGRVNIKLRLFGQDNPGPLSK